MIFSCCGNLKFAYVPFVGYSRLFPDLVEVSLTISFVLISPVLLAKLINCFLKSDKRLNNKNTSPESKEVRRQRARAYATFLFTCVSFIFLSQKNIIQFTESTKAYLDQIKSSYIVSEVDQGLIKEGWEYYDHARTKFRRVPPYFSRPVKINMLTEEECSVLSRAIMAKKDSFIHISHLAGPLPFFTYGPYWGYHYFEPISNHLDSTESVARKNDALGIGEIATLTSESITYEKAVSLFRDGMLEEFGDLYSLLTRKLSSFLSGGKKKVEFVSNAGIPGFHVIPSHKAWSFPVFRFHTDEGYDLIREGLGEAFVQGCDPESRISFTLPLQLPGEEGEGGLNFVDVSDGSKALEDLMVERERYSVGNMVIHSGMLVHQIGEWKYETDEARITMQGFGFECGDVWKIYW